MFRPDAFYTYALRLLCLVLTLTGLMGSLALPYSAAASGQTRTNADNTTRAAQPVGQREPLKTEQMKQFYQLPMSFEANQGQSDRRVKFLSRGQGYTLFLTPTEAVLSLRQQQNQDSAVLRMKLIGANPKSQVAGQDELPGKVNYFKGRDRAGLSSNVSTYAKVYYQEIYPGVDMVYYGKQQQLEYDFILEPNRDPGKIRLGFTGARGLVIEETGDLVLETAAGKVRQQRPVAYQEINGQRREVAASYVLKGQRQVGFEVGDYDPARPLVIDPVLDYSTYLGGGGIEEGNDIAVGADGKIYVTGWTTSVNFPLSANPYDNTCQSCPGWGTDAFITKLDPSQSGAASLVYSSFIGTSPGNTEGRAIAVDSSNNIYITGITSWKNFPTTANALQPDYLPFSNGNAFLTKLDATGSSLLYSTYLAGNNVDEGADVAVDANDNIYVAGRTASTNFPITPMSAYQVYNAGIFDGFVMKFDHLGGGSSYAQTYSTYLGGNNGDEATHLALDSSGHVYLTGTTQSADLSGTSYYDGFPVLNGFQTALSAGGDAFMTKIDPTKVWAASLLYSTYLGGSNHENSAVQVGGIAVDYNNKAYVTGMTNSANFPIKNALDATLGGYDAFVTKIDATLSGDASLVYSTYLGGLAQEYGNDIAVDALGQVYVAGMTQSNDFPLTQCTFPNAPYMDGFITVLDSNGSSLVYSTYLGGNGYDFINAIAVDANGTAFVTGHTDATNFPVTPGAYQPNLGGLTPNSYYKDAFVTKITPTRCPGPQCPCP